MAIAPVTGGTGTLGRLVVRKLIERKYQPQKQRVVRERAITPSQFSCLDQREPKSFRAGKGLR
jgi:uncharacterized protein YbjT (DUF2867 family)